jgi:dihydrofolate reductase
MRRFKALTLGKPIIMGRKTWDSFPKKPLPGRTNIVVTRDRSWQAPGAVVTHSFDEALEKARSENPSAIAVVGGAEIYKTALPHADRVELTQVHNDVSGDTHLAPFDESAWRETAREDRTTGDGLRFSYVTLVRA